MILLPRPTGLSRPASIELIALAGLSFAEAKKSELHKAFPFEPH